VICTLNALGFVSVTFWAVLVPISWLAKESVLGEGTILSWSPTPKSGTVCGLPAELSVMVNVPVRVPTCVGVKVTPMAQLPPAGDTVVQLFDATAKSPLMATLETVKAFVPRS
jgi:hypothetical protein